MTSNALAEHIQRVNKIDDSVYLGKLVWYTVSEVCISHAEVIRGLTTVGLGSQLPSAPRGFDVFRRVSSKAARTKVPTAVDGVLENYLVREVAGRGEDQVVRRVVCEQVDRNLKKLDYNADLCDIEFTKSTGLVSTTLSPTLNLVNGLALNTDLARQRATCLSIVAEIQNEYARWKDKLDSYAIREFIRKMVINRFSATLVREGGGVYFVQEDQSKDVEALEAFVNGIPGASFHVIPLLDDLKQREMVRKAFEAESIDEIDELLGEISKIHQDSTTISTDRYARILVKYKELREKTNNYGSLLETSLGEVHSRLHIFQNSVVKLKSRVRA